MISIGPLLIPIPALIALLFAVSITVYIACTAQSRTRRQITRLHDARTTNPDTTTADQ